jgi:transposase
MDKKKRKIIQKKGKHYSETERHSIIQEMFKNNWTKQYTWELYTGEPEERGQLMRWMRKLGYVKEIRHKKFNFGPKIKLMRNKDKGEPPGSESFEVLQLKKRIAELEKQLKDAEMKAIAYSTMVDIAEKEFNIPIKKKLNTKPSQK